MEKLVSDFPRQSKIPINFIYINLKWLGLIENFQKFCFHPNNIIQKHKKKIMKINTVVFK